MRKLLFSFVLIWATVSVALSQNRVVSGLVTDESRAALPGVSVIVKGSTVGTVTDVNGRYSIEVPSDASILVYSFVGMQTQEQTVGVRSTIDVSMVEDVRALSEVVVVGYGEQNRRDLTGSVTSVAGVDVNKMPVASWMLPCRAARQVCWSLPLQVHLVPVSISRSGATLHFRPVASHFSW